MVASEPSNSHWKELWLPALFCLLLLCAEFYVLFNGLSLQTPSPALPLTPIGKISTTIHDVKHKPSHTLIWSPAADLQELQELDALVTLPDSKAKIVFNDDSELEIEPESLIILETAPKVANDKTPISLRLIRGSIRRTKSSSTPFFVKLDSKPGSKAVKIISQESQTVFRVIHREKGFEIIVETGKIQINNHSELSASEKANLYQNEEGEFLLPAPLLKKPIIKIRSKNKKSSQRGVFQDLLDFLIPSAHAETATTTPGTSPTANPNDSLWIEVDFEWEENPKATSYRIQTSWDPDFQELIHDEKIKEAKFVFETKAPSIEKKVYFRVAAIDSRIKQGPFSSVAEVTIKPEDAKVMHAEKVRKGGSSYSSSSGGKSFQPITLPEIHLPENTHLKANASYGAAYQYRNFQGPAGSGFVPLNFSAQAILYRKDRMSFALSADILIQKTKLRQTALVDTFVDTPLFHVKPAVILQLNPWLDLHPMLILTNTVSSLSNGSQGVQISRKALVGAGVAFTLHSQYEHTFFPKLEILGLGLGDQGVDLNLGARMPLLPGKKVALETYTGFFMGIEINQRWIKSETLTGGLLELGFQI